MLKLESERLAKGWSKAELARQAWLNSATVNEATTGKRRPGGVQLEKLARALGWPEDRSADELMDEVSDDGDE